ncbi:MAG TPA: VOC family protein [Planctomycetota bacterium]|nr:VOC family protein [Planctomycetota bacterium]
MPVKTKSRPRAKTATKNAAPAKNGKKPIGKPSLSRLAYAIVFTTDMKRGVAFYQDTLGIPLRFATDEWTEFEMQGLSLALHEVDRMPKNLDQAPIAELCFESADVRTTREQLKGSGVEISELRSVCEMGNDVGVTATFRDPDGNHLSIFGMVPKAQWTGPADC